MSNWIKFLGGAAGLGLALGLASSSYAAEQPQAADAAKSAQPAEAKLADAKPAEAKATDAKPADAKPAAKAKIWSWQQVQKPAEPEVKQKAWVRTPVDAYVLAQLEAKNIKPSTDADRAAFVRRATLDVWGVIPTTQQVQAFVNDKSPNAYEKLVDGLLASPRYGERQARRWLDLARYADSSGFTNDETRPNMWRYRDYVINSFNQDKPYNRFIQEQLAGDELWPGSPDALIATGFLRGYPDDSNSRDLVQKKYQNTTDITDTVGEVFLAQTVGCARCHNHKFDKISQKDYFQLQAFFANVHAVDNIPAAKGEQELQYEQAYAKWDKATKDIRDKQKAILDPVRKQAEQYNFERFSQATQDSLNKLRKSEKEWTPNDRWINHRYVANQNDAGLAAYFQDTSKEGSPGYVEGNAAKYAEYKRLADELKKFDKIKPDTGSDTISAITELGFKDAPATYVRFAGVFDRPMEEVQPAFPSGITDDKPQITPTAFSSGRRAALANWIASPQNPLTARVYVNRVWEQLFGNGIVKTVSDFGKAGDKPTNPELLDYLADNFVKQGWSVKKLQREILLSSVYRQSSNFREDVFKVDPEDKLLAVFPRKRLEAEEIRDSLLLASGQLEEKVGGPSVYAPVPANLGAGNLWKVSNNPKDWNRRSLYIFTRRSVPYPLLDTFDMASAQQVHSKREVTTTPLQALALINSDVVFGWSQALAGRVITEAGNDESAQIDRLYQVLFSRNPDRTEKAALQAFLTNQQKVIRDKAAEESTSGKFAINIPTGLKDDKRKNLDPIRAAAFVDLVHTVANSNEFSYRF